MRNGLIPLLLLAAGCASGYRDLEFANARATGQIGPQRVHYYSITTNRPQSIALLLPGELTANGEKLTPAMLERLADYDAFLLSGASVTASADKERWTILSPDGLRSLTLSFEQEKLVLVQGIVPAAMPRGLPSWSPAFARTVDSPYHALPLLESELQNLFGPVIRRVDRHPR